MVIVGIPPYHSRSGYNIFKVPTEAPGPTTSEAANPQVGPYLRLCSRNASLAQYHAMSKMPHELWTIR
jgi:hypothetical protein